MSKYSIEFKVKVVKKFLKGNVGSASLSKKYNIPTPRGRKRQINTRVSIKLALALGTTL